MTRGQSSGIYLATRYLGALIATRRPRNGLRSRRERCAKEERERQCKEENEKKESPDACLFVYLLLALRIMKRAR